MGNCANDEKAAALAQLFLTIPKGTAKFWIGQQVGGDRLPNHRNGINGVAAPYVLPQPEN